ncbi:MAG: DUF4252 domain-containing protein [Planctomycetota bacterium]
MACSRLVALLAAPMVSISAASNGLSLNAAPVESGATAQQVSLDYPDAPPATVELSLSAGLFSDLFGITESAVQGVIDAATRFGQEADDDQQEAIQLTAEQLALSQKVLSIVKGSIQSVELRVYKNAADGMAPMKAYYNQQLASAGWDRVLRVADGDDQVEVALSRDAGGISGAFFMASNNVKELVIAVVDCTLSPEKMQELTDTVTTGALDAGLGEEIEKAVQEIKREIEREIN